MGTFLLLLFIFFVVWPLCRLAWRIWTATRQFNRARDNAREAFRQAYGHQPEETPHPKKKKIDSSVGEYVAFEEIACDVETKTATDPAGRTATVTESQVEDAVWVDIHTKE